MYEIFEKLCMEKGVTIREVSRNTGVASATFSDWKMGRSHPRNDKMKRIADYFGVSVEYLKTGQEKSTPIPEDEDALDEQLVAMLKKLDENQIQRVLDFVAGMLTS